MELNHVYQGDALSILKQWPDNCIDCVVTSPPYWGLRSYGTEPVVWGGEKDCKHEWRENINAPKGGKGSLSANVSANRNDEANLRDKPTVTNFCLKCQAWKGELGLEPDFNLYIQHLVQIFREIKRVLKPTGTCWVNLGDSYNGSGGDHKEGKKNDASFQGEYSVKCGGSCKHSLSLKPKSLCGIPERFVLAMTDQLRFIHRNTIIWFKRNCMPSSATDRFTVDFEPVYFFTKSKKYFFEQQFEPHKRLWDKSNGGSISTGRMEKCKGGMGKRSDDKYPLPNPLGRNMRCVWDIPTKPFSGAHFAVFPDTLVTRMIKAGCPPGGVVLDPFMGSGTVGLTAVKNGRRYLGIELNSDYISMAKSRIYAELPMRQEYLLKSI